MCGIGAVFGKKLENGESIIRDSLSAITHRGYSLYETASFPDCALGANRLEIVDEKNARQPVANEDNTLFVVFNGEIYNHKDLRKELAGLGHRFRSESDTEVLVHLYEEHGPEMVKRLDSEMFAFVIYDRKRNKMFAARDPYGVKPLYHATDIKGRLHFASEVKQLARFDDISEIMEFPAGHYMADNRITQYHAIPGASADAGGDVEGIIGEIRTLFDDAVRKRVDTSLPVGVLFSGGLDSAAVLATALKYNSNVTAITVAGKDSSDRKTADRYCREFGVRLIAGEPLDDDEVTRRTDEFIRVAESYEPRIIAHLAAYEGIIRLARDGGFRIVLCGEGADELLGGYAPFEMAAHGKRLPELFDAYVSNLPRTQFQRLDRSAMYHTIEARAPFFDTRFADYIMNVPAGLKVRPGMGDCSVKWIFREAMKDRLPGYIAERTKIPLHRNSKALQDEDRSYLYRRFKGMADREESDRLAAQYPGWEVRDEIEAYTFKVFAEAGYTKAAFNKKRLYDSMPQPGIIEKIRYWPLRILRSRAGRMLS